ncbi:(d)CMP kinase [Xylocopilactobacillus apicola]|uniref:Cytidylate kinase n=1 Tax=Xylocopilactobacillus apicola TaxID=2932184 RepID=A0AAU9D8E7_9LACO|nr:(d)CMP kinase [Xylocopilactobacillus apicola]BDR58661.1 cytidylate kinase [Xylocopilactobacillus apicola]
MIQIAIDGPASSGKSTVAKIIAEKLNFLYVDTGAMYRALTYYCLEKKINLNDEESVMKLLNQMNYEVKVVEEKLHYFVDQQDVSEQIRKPDVAKNVSKVASYPKIRKYLTELQQEIARKNNVVMDGRDIGTVVLPQANFKFFLTATPEVRANRRFKENQNKGISSDLSEIIQAIKKRDEIDSHRKIAPLIPANDAILVDSSNMTIEQVVTNLINRIQG